jgi:fructoselysine-6-P-deglycase FrlB-like protein
LITNKIEQNHAKFLTLEVNFAYRCPMTIALHADAEIASQPQIWRQVADFAPSVFGKLPQKGERVAVVGCGSSWFMSMAYASLREAAGHGETDAYAGSEFNYDRKYDRVVSISRSGTTTEVVELLGKIKVPSVVLTVQERATETIIMDFADEQSVLQTRWATAALGLLRAHLGFDLNSIVKDAEAALESDISALTEVEQISFIGRGWTIALAHEAALKTRESSQFWAEAYPALDYRHGPLSISQPGRAVWAFGDISADLVRDIKSTGALFESSMLDPMAHLIRAQRVAIAIAKKRGLDADSPRGLSRSIILDK